MTVLNTYSLSLKYFLSSEYTSLPNLVLASYNVRSIPLIGVGLLNLVSTSLIVFIKSANPSSAKYSAWIGINTLSAAINEFIVIIPRDGGRSIIM